MQIDVIEDDPVGTSGLETFESFEHPAPTAPVRPLAWSVEKYNVAQLLALSRLSLTEISEQTCIPVSTIRRWRRHPDFQEYMNKLVLDGESSLKAKRLMLLSKMLDARIAIAEEHGSYASLSGKDTLEIMAEIRKETDEKEGQEKSQYVQIVEHLLKKTKENQQQPLLVQGNPSDD